MIRADTTEASGSAASSLRLPIGRNPSETIGPAALAAALAVLVALSPSRGGAVPPAPSRVPPEARALTAPENGRSPAENAPREAKPHPNFVIIISDDHGWGDYGFMGSRDVRTPNLDRLASQSLVTGLYPHQHKITSNDPPVPPGVGRGEFYRSKEFAEGREAMNRHLEAVATLPQLLAARGYPSLQTGKWWQGDYRRGRFTHGMTRGERHGDRGLEIGRSTMAPIREFLEEAVREKRPFFIWYAPMMPHEPHDPPERILARYRDGAPSEHLARYWAMAEWFDETCGELLRLLEEKGVSENTLVIYLADNGWTQKPDGSGPLRSKGTPYDAGLRTPILLKWAGQIAPRSSDRPVLSIDIAPTILAAAGLDIPRGMPGANLLWRWAVQDRWKLIIPAGSEAVELYDVIADPRETEDLAKKEPDIVESLLRKLDAWWRPL